MMIPFGGLCLVMKLIPRNLDYGATKSGRIWSCKRKRFLKPYLRHGYPTVSLGRKSEHRVHRLILETFVGPCPGGMECRHLNGNRQDNRLENLCWGTRSENRYDAVKHGTLHTGERCNLSKLTESIVQNIRRIYQTTNRTQQEIANIYNTSIGNVCMIVNQKSCKTF